ncbi:MAG TPA: glutathione S-transferase family protein [Gammaproteobacteria bacterium]
MKLYDFPAAPSPRKVILFMAEKRIDIPRVILDLRAGAQHDPDFLARNPSGTVPVLELDDGTCLTESLAICQYLEALHPEPNLFGESALERAQVSMWNDIATLEGYAAIQEALRNRSAAFAGRALPGVLPCAQIPALVERGERRANAFFDRLDARLRESEYVACARYTYADIAAYVYATFAERVFKRSPADRRPSLQRWMQAVEARPAVRAAG